jgi:hypothetical protein
MIVLHAINPITQHMGTSGCVRQRNAFKGNYASSS